MTESRAVRDADPERLEISVGEDVPVILFVNIDERVSGDD